MKKFFTMLLAITITMCSSLYAEPQVQKFEETLDYLFFLEIPTISISKTEKTILDSPVSSYLVTQEEIQKKGYLTLQDAMDHIPGLYTVDLSDSEWNDTEIYVRGLYSNRKLTFLLDGHRITPPTGEPFTYLKDIALINVKQIEVSLGAASSLYGADAMAGIVNIVTFSYDEMKQLKTDLTYGSYDTLNGQFFAGYSFNKDISASVSGSYMQTKTADFVNEIPEIYDVDGLDVDLSQSNHTFQAKADIYDFNVSYYRLYKKRPNTFGFNPLAYDPSGELFWETLNQFITLDYNLKINEQWSSKTTVSYNSTELTPDSAFPLDPYGYDPRINNFQWKGSSTNIAEEILFEIDNLKWITGLGFEYLDSIPKEPSLYLEELGGRVHKYYNNTSLFSQVEYNAFNNLDLTAGIRYDSNSLFEPVVNPRLGAMWKITPEIRINTSWGTSYLAPTPHKIYDRYGDPTVFIGVANEDLKPERSMSYELGTSIIPVKDMLIRLSGFGLEGRDLFENADYPTPSDPDHLAYNAIFGYGNSENLAKVNIWGAQLNIQSRVNNWLELEGDYLFLSGQQTTADHQGMQELVRVPRHHANAHAIFSYNPFTLRLSANWFDRIFDEGNPVINGDVYNGSFTLDAYLGFLHKIQDLDIKIGLTAKNLLDKEYSKINYYSNWIGVGLPELPQPRRTIYLTLSAKY